MTGTEGALCSARPSIVRWPHDAARRDELVAEGRPVLLVVTSATDLPVLADLEDFVIAGTDERDVAQRLRSLARRAPGLAGTGGTAVSLGPPVTGQVVAESSTTAAQARAIGLLLEVPGRLVRRVELAATGADELVASIADVLATIGWSVVTVETAGWLVERHREVEP